MTRTLRASWPRRPRSRHAAVGGDPAARPAAVSRRTHPGRRRPPRPRAAGQASGGRSARGAPAAPHRPAAAARCRRRDRCPAGPGRCCPRPRTRNQCSVSGTSRVRGSSSAPVCSSLSRARPGALPAKRVVSITAWCSTPGTASRTTSQSCPSSRRRAVSQPSDMTWARPGASALAGWEKNMLLHASTRPPAQVAARSTRPPSRRGSGTTSPNTRSRATPPSGWMVSRTCVTSRSGAVTGTRLARSPPRSAWSASGVQAAAQHLGHRGVAEQRGPGDRGRLRVVSPEVRGVDVDPAHDRGRGQPDDDEVLTRFPPPPGLPAVVLLAADPEGRRIVARRAAAR